MLFLFSFLLFKPYLLSIDWIFLENKRLGFEFLTKDWLILFNDLLENNMDGLAILFCYFYMSSLKNKYFEIIYSTPHH